MIDFVKAVSDDQLHINKMHNFAIENLKPHKPQNNNYLCFSNGSGRFRLEFRKVHSNNQLVGFRSVEVCFSPHYKFNNDLHNGNDFTPKDSIKTIHTAFIEIGITENEMSDFKVVNLEYGVNLQTGVNVENLVSGLLYTNKTEFQTRSFPYFKISDSTKYKEIKAYAKGLQFVDFPQYGIDRDVFRFEVRTKQSKLIRKMGINCAKDLTNTDKYNALFQSLLDEWEQILLTNLEADLSDLKTEEVLFVQSGNKIDFWTKMIGENYRNKFTRYKEKYYKILTGKNNLHTQIKWQIIDKLFSFQSGADSTHRTTINKGKDSFKNNAPLLINLESAPPIKKIEANTARKESKILSFFGLEYYQQNDLKTYCEILKIKNDGEIFII